MKNRVMAVVIGYAFLVTVTGAVAAISTFDEEALILAPETHWGGAGSAETGFVSGDAYFPHNADDWSWDGFLYSNETNTTTVGFMNQFSAIAGGGVKGSANYGVAAIPLDWLSGTYEPIPQTITFEESTELSGAYFTNIVYSYLSMRDGDDFAKKFGGADGTDPDYLRLVISGIDQYGDASGTIIFYLADFRSPDSHEDYIVDQWTWVDLSSLGSVVHLELTMESSDMGMFGINTPTYFGIDNLTTASEPAVDVVVDIRPGSQDNCVNIQSRRWLPVTISGTESFDIETIEIASLRLQGIMPLRSFKIDISRPTAGSESTSPTTFGGDGYRDLILLFDTQQVISALGNVSEGQVLQLDMSGTLKDGSLILGSDEILIKGNCPRR